MKNYRWPKAYQILIKKALKSLDRIIVFNASEQEELERFCGGLRSIVIANGIEKISSKNIKPLESFKNKHIDQSKKVLFVGAVNKLKGVEDLIQIAHELSEKESINVKFIFAGPIHSDVTVDEAPDNTIFFGPNYTEPVSRYISAGRHADSTFILRRYAHGNIRSHGKFFACYHD